MKKTNWKVAEKYEFDKKKGIGFFYNIDEKGGHDILLIPPKTEFVQMIVSSELICENFEKWFNETYMNTMEVINRPQQIIPTRKESGTVSEGFVLKLIAMTVSEEKYKDIK